MMKRRKNKKKIKKMKEEGSDDRGRGQVQER